MKMTYSVKMLGDDNLLIPMNVVSFDLVILDINISKLLNPTHLDIIPQHFQVRNSCFYLKHITAYP
jgi:hypothetical protein